MYYLIQWLTSKHVCKITESIYRFYFSQWENCLTSSYNLLSFIWLPRQVSYPRYLRAYIGWNFLNTICHTFFIGYFNSVVEFLSQWDIPKNYSDIGTFGDMGTKIKFLFQKTSRRSKWRHNLNSFSILSGVEQ